MEILKRNILRISLLLVLVFAAINIQAYAEDPPVSDVQDAAPHKVQLKAPVVDEMSEEDAKKAQEDAQIKEELNKAQKTMGEAAPLRVEDSDFNPVGDDSITQNVVPNTGKELTRLIFLFSKVMLGVLVATILLYFILVATKKFFHPPLPQRSEEDFDVRDLNSPKSTDDALKSFLDRTDD